MVVVYYHLAQKLTAWENHRTETEHEHSLTFKLFLFQCVNYYSAIVYIAIFKGSSLPLWKKLYFTKQKIVNFFAQTWKQNQNDQPEHLLLTTNADVCQLRTHFCIMLNIAI